MTFILIVIAAYTTVWFVSALKPISTGALVFFLIWLICPYTIMSAALIFLLRKGIASDYAHGVTISVAIGGVLFLADVLFWHPDSQGAISVLITPMLQISALGLLLPVLWRVSRNTQTKQRSHPEA
ncbi:MAG: hypothetical protein ABL903_10980 [Methylococcales bacterium]